VASVCCLAASTRYCLAVSVAVGVGSNGLRVVRLLPAVVWLGVVVTIGYFLVCPGYLTPRIFCMSPALVTPTRSPVRKLPVPFQVLRTHRLGSLAYPGPTLCMLLRKFVGLVCSSL